MGQSINSCRFTAEQYCQFSQRLQDNLLSLEHLLSRDEFGVGPRSLGVELELYIVGKNNLPQFYNLELGEKINDPNLTMELNRYNLEYNFPPLSVDSDIFSTLHQQLRQTMAKLRCAAQEEELDILAIGILPTLRGTDFGQAAMTDLPRYHALTNGLKGFTDGQFHIDIGGIEPLQLDPQTVTLEGANTSLQIHYRVNPADFVDLYNAIQLATPLAVAVSANSPMFLGHRLWHETRIPLFKQSIDSRLRQHSDWHEPARVCFGHGWLRNSAYELFAESVNLYPPLLPIVDDEDSMARIARGETPELSELRLHQSSVWQWNRPVYDAVDGGHLRIEMRALPAGPTAIDMTANAAFIIGLAEGLKPVINKLLPALPFDIAKKNFYRAAHKGLGAELIWPCDNSSGLETKPVVEIAKQLMPIAYQGLSNIGVSDSESEKMLSIIEERIEHRRNGAKWQLTLFDKLQSYYSLEESLSLLVDHYMAEAEKDRPVALWDLQP